VEAGETEAVELCVLWTTVIKCLSHNTQKQYQAVGKCGSCLACTRKERHVETETAHIQTVYTQYVLTCHTYYNHCYTYCAKATGNHTCNVQCSRDSPLQCAEKTTRAYYI